MMLGIVWKSKIFIISRCKVRCDFCEVAFRVSEL